MSIPNHPELKSLLQLNRCSNQKAVMVALSQGLSPAQALEILGAQNPRLLENKFNPDKEIEACAKKGIRLLTLFDENYPAILKEIHHPPLVLYVEGNFDARDAAALAIVGTRHPSFYGVLQAKRFAKELAQDGMTIVSGFAKGVDQIAHEAALEISYGRTVAVLGCGLDVDYPKGSRRLFDKIKERGGVLSEYPLGTDPRAENFPRRNRIISGLSLGVLVVEAHSRSGSLITAHEAIEQGREVFAIPGPVDRLTSQGTHRLIKEGAMLVESPTDIMQNLSLALRVTPAAVFSGSEKTSVEPLPETQSEKDALLDFLQAGPKTLDEITHRCELKAHAVVSKLTQLELARKIRRNPDGRFILAEK